MFGLKKRKAKKLPQRTCKNCIYYNEEIEVISTCQKKNKIKRYTTCDWIKNEKARLKSLKACKLHKFLYSIQKKFGLDE